jgi:Fe2+ or Zn2+ uptake regulation protein
VKALKNDCGEKIVQILTRTDKPVDVLVLVKKIGVNKTTVYRQLKKLIQNNIIFEVEFGDGKKRYELKSLGHHHHIVCKSCGDLEEISFDEKQFSKYINNKTEYKIESHSLEFFGLCPTCK